MPRLKNTLWMAVTSDKYELPLMVTDTAKELSLAFGLEQSTVAKNVLRNSNTYRKDYKFVKVILED